MMMRTEAHSGPPFSPAKHPVSYVSGEPLLIMIPFLERPLLKHYSRRGFPSPNGAELSLPSFWCGTSINAAENGKPCLLWGYHPCCKFMMLQSHLAPFLLREGMFSTQGQDGIFGSNYISVGWLLLTPFQIIHPRTCTLSTLLSRWLIFPFLTRFPS